MESLVVIGNDKIAVDCLRLLDRRNVRPALVVHADDGGSGGKRLASYCEKSGVDRCSATGLDESTVARITATRPDLILNISSFWIIREPLLSLPTRGIVNFHNGPLPHYRGVNIPSWAIIRGEKQHGVTWHWVEEGIDAGDIIAQRHFAVTDDDTALSLTFRCIVEGTELFDECIDDLLADRAPRRPQLGEGSYFSLRDIPNGGRVPFTATVDEVSRFVRGLDFRPFPNTFTYARASCRGREFIVSSVRRADLARGDEPPGTVREVSSDGLAVTVADGVVRVEEVMDDRQEELDVGEFARGYGIAPGDVLDG